MKVIIIITINLYYPRDKKHVAITLITVGVNYPSDDLCVWRGACGK